MATILFFGRFGEQFGREVDVDLPAGGCTVRELRELLIERLPAADESWRNRCISICVDQVILGEDDPVRPGQEIAVMPPLSGG
jgi:molybdopterin converting factor small subunit